MKKFYSFFKIGLFALTFHVKSLSNDQCADAPDVTLVTAAMADDFDGQTEGTTQDGTFDPTNYLFPNAQCFGTNTAGGEFSDVWYQFNTLGNEEIELRFYSSGDNTGSFYAELFNACDMQVDTSVIFGSCVFVNPAASSATTLIGNLPLVPTIYLMRVTTRLTTQLPGDFFFFLVAEITAPSAAQEQLDFPGTYQVFPNPAGDKLYLNLMLDKTVETTVKIVNPFGQTVRSQDRGSLPKGDYQLDFDVSDLAAGVYFLQLYSEQGLGTVRFVKD